jgi:hypothetical protein
MSRRDPQGKIAVLCAEWEGSRHGAVLQPGNSGITLPRGSAPYLLTMSIMPDTWSSLQMAPQPIKLTFCDALVVFIPLPDPRGIEISHEVHLGRGIWRADSKCAARKREHPAERPSYWEYL